MAAGYLDITYQSSAGAASWTASRDVDGELLPYAYTVNLVGEDQAGRPMHLELAVTPTRAPVPVGASTYNGKMACFGQDDTYSYFQTGMTMTGTLRWGDEEEQVSGTAGHIDRQWFPKYAGGGGSGGDPRARSHEWRTIHFDNGVDMSIWRQFDRMDGNALQPFTGVTVSHPDLGDPPECAEDIKVTISSYVKWPNSIRPLVRPLAPARYMADRHRITSDTLQLDLVGEPLVAAPAHGLPIEYMEGPYRYRGTYRGEQVTAFAFNERSLAMYRDWELVEVLATTTTEIDDPELNSQVDQLVPLVAAGRRTEAAELLSKMRPGRDGMLATLLDDFVAVLAEQDSAG
jgi:predicted secreted hydrolase